MKYAQLGKTGLAVSQVGFGGVALGNLYGDIDDNEGICAVHAAVDYGINLFDTSTYYGQGLSETRLGQALKGKRDQIILATKGGRFAAPLETGFDFSFDSIINMCEASLRRLQTDYLDIYQLHDIEFGDKDQVINEAIPALRQLKQAGKVRFIGVTGYPLPLLNEMVTTQGLDVVLSYSHYNLMNTTLDSGLVPAVQVHEVGLMNGSVTNMGLLTDQGPQPWHPAPDKVKQVAQDTAVYCRQQGTPLAHLAIQFALQNPHVDTTLLGTRTLTELEQSITLLESKPNPELLANVLNMIAPVADMSWPSGRPENYE